MGCLTLEMPQPAQYAQAEAPKAAATNRIIRLTVNRAVINLRPRSFCRASPVISFKQCASRVPRAFRGIYVSKGDEFFFRLGKKLRQSRMIRNRDSGELSPGIAAENGNENVILKKAPPRCHQRSGAQKALSQITWQACTGDWRDYEYTRPYPKCPDRLASC